MNDLADIIRNDECLSGIIKIDDTQCIVVNSKKWYISVIKWVSGEYSLTINTHKWNIIDKLTASHLLINYHEYEDI